MLNVPPPLPPLAGGVGSYNHHDIGEEDGVEASVGVCQPLSKGGGLQSAIFRNFPQFPANFSQFSPFPIF